MPNDESQESTERPINIRASEPTAPADVSSEDLLGPPPTPGKNLFEEQPVIIDLGRKVTITAPSGTTQGSPQVSTQDQGGQYFSDTNELDDDDGNSCGTQVILPKTVEKKMAEYVQDNPFIYDKGDKNFRNREKKRKFWEDRGLEFNETGDRMQRWFDSKRSTYGRLRKKIEKSGNARHRFTAKKWAFDLMELLESHILRHRPGHDLGT